MLKTIDPPFLAQMDDEERKIASQYIETYSVMYFEGGWEISLDMSRTAYGCYHKCEGNNWDAVACEDWTCSAELHMAMEDFIVSVEGLYLAADGNVLCSLCNDVLPKDIYVLARMMRM